ncbi:alpha/beta hydrolase [Bombiscardovia apis]|uniref:Alpha/beta hydrolase n=1 Tax=Bombiscardovia apis TaxID=2932182 RepID=A0ABN6SI15_9BIFI|nr:alpha/beta hydrolase [Bombiscardovia apis]BDR55434.1 alpha/beta hydrolase [Bombiscardovia apis]
MAKQRHTWVRLVLGILITLLALALCCIVPATSGLRQEEKYVQSRVPTFFLHGWNGSYLSEMHMVNAIKDAGVSKTAVRVDVDAEGQAQLLAAIPEDATNPLIEVSLLDKTNADYRLCGTWFKAALEAVRSQYYFDEYKVVAHSMGNMVLLNYLRDTANDAQRPRLIKQADLAGNFNGIIGNNDLPNRMTFNEQGLPSPQTYEFQSLLGLRTTYPDKQVDVLNIFGDLDDGSHSDGNITNASSQSLRYLLGGRARTYREITIHGSQGRHSNLHESDQVDRELIGFLW